MKEVPGAVDNPAILAMLRLDAGWPEHDEVPWCSAFANWIVWHFRGLPRSKSLRARSWLLVGTPMDDEARWEIPIGFTVVILKRGGGNQPGPEVIKAQGHVGFLAGFDTESNRVGILGGNQSDGVNVSHYPIDRILGIRSLI